MQKIQSYLYTNRIQLLADVAGFTTEYTNVYQKTVKIYNGVDNVLEFDIKNADQKRIDLSTLSNIELNVMAPHDCGSTRLLQFSGLGSKTNEELLANNTSIM